MQIKREVTETCRACAGAGFWMAPVYHNERARETCSTCRGRGERVIATRIVQATTEPFPKATS